MRRRTKTCLFLALLCPILSTPRPAAAEELNLATFTGIFNFGDRRAGPGHTADPEMGFEVHWGCREIGLLPGHFPLRPILGAAATVEGSYWAFVGMRYERRLDRRWTLAPSIALSFYEQDDGKNLGGAVQFRSALEVSYQMGERWRLGAMLYHLSNAGIYHPNPGSESLLLTVTVPLGR